MVCSHLDHMFCPDGLELSLFVRKYERTFEGTKVIRYTRTRTVRVVYCIYSHLGHMFYLDGLELSLFVIRYTHSVLYSARTSAPTCRTG